MPWLKFFFDACRYFTDGLQTIEHFGTYIEDLMNRLSHIRTEQEEERRDLIDVRNTLKNSPGFNKMVSGAAKARFHVSRNRLMCRATKLEMFTNWLCDRFAFLKRQKNHIR
jgi:diphthamide synthase (EF-2-diphthine--ammonia ligase)